MGRKPAGVVMIRDPENRQTLILDRWPTAKEKTKAFREEVAKVRGVSLPVVEEPVEPVEPVDPPTTDASPGAGEQGDPPITDPSPGPGSPE